MNTNTHTNTNGMSSFLDFLDTGDQVTNQMIYDKLLEIQAAQLSSQSSPSSLRVADNEVQDITKHHCSCCVLRRGGHILGLDAPEALGDKALDNNAFGILAGEFTPEEIKSLLTTLNDGSRTYQSISAKSEKIECVNMTIEELKRHFRWMNQTEEAIMREANRRFEITYYYCKVFVRFHLSNEKNFRWVDISRVEQDKYIVAFEEMMRRITASAEVDVSINDVIHLELCKKGWAARNLLRYSLRNLNRKSTGSNSTPSVTGRRNRTPNHRFEDAVDEIPSVRDNSTVLVLDNSVIVNGNNSTTTITDIIGNLDVSGSNSNISNMSFGGGGFADFSINAAAAASADASASLARSQDDGSFEATGGHSERMDGNQFSSGVITDASSGQNGEERAAHCVALSNDPESATGAGETPDVVGTKKRPSSRRGGGAAAKKTRGMKRSGAAAGAARSNKGRSKRAAQ